MNEIKRFTRAKYEFHTLDLVESFQRSPTLDFD